MSRTTRSAAALVLAAVLSATAGCGPSPAPHRATVSSPAQPAQRTSPAPQVSPSGPAGRPDHVVVAVFENKAYRQLKGNPQAPYLNVLMNRSATFVDAHGVTHPSQPNYLALFSGSTQGVTDDHCLGPFHDRPNLGRQLLDAGYTFTGYSEDLPRAGYRGCTYGRYAAKHNPWVDFDNVPAVANQPYTAWPADPARLPAVAFVVPNLCDDMHDCGIATGDAWARAHLDPYVQWADTHRSLLVLTFDENDGGAGNQILTLIAGAGVTPGIRTDRIDHYTVLRTIEQFFGLPPIGSAAQAGPISGLGFPGTAGQQEEPSRPAVPSPVSTDSRAGRAGGR
jgi:acid phosphatase